MWLITTTGFYSTRVTSNTEVSITNLLKGEENG